MLFYFDKNKAGDEALYFDSAVAVENADVVIPETGINETKILCGDRVDIIRHENGGRLYYVSVYGCEGVVGARGIGRCTKATADAYCNSSKFMIVKEYFHDNSGRFFRMGSRFPYIEDTTGNKLCLIPYNTFGIFCVYKADINLQYLNEGYMECNAENILSLAMSALGMPYGWGDEKEGIDCSSFVRNIFRCMGLHLPRNVCDMLKMNCTYIDINDINRKDIGEMLSREGVGSLVFTKKHVMIYAGRQEGVPVYIHCTSRMGGGCVKTHAGVYEGEIIRILGIKEIINNYI